MSNYFTPEQIERLRNFTPPAQPTRKTRRKGSLRVANVCSALASADTTTTPITTWDVESRLRALGMWDDLWPGVSPEGAAKLLGDLLGAHGLRLPSIDGKKGLAKRYLIPPGGITPEYCAKNNIELVDNPTNEIIWEQTTPEQQAAALLAQRDALLDTKAKDDGTSEIVTSEEEVPLAD